MNIDLKVKGTIIINPDEAGSNKFMFLGNGYPVFGPWNQSEVFNSPARAYEYIKCVENELHQEVQILEVNSVRFDVTPADLSEVVQARNERNQLLVNLKKVNAKLGLPELSVS